MMYFVLCLIASIPAQAQFRAALPAPVLPTARVAAPLVAPVLAPSLTPAMAGPALAPTLRSVLPAVVPAAVVAARAAAPAALPAAAESARPAVAGKTAWTGLFDGRAPRSANAIDGLPAGLGDELDFWRELTAHDEGRSMTTLEAAAFKSFLAQASAWTEGGVPRRLTGPAASRPETGRHPALLEAAARWRRQLRRAPDAQRAADIAAEVRNHRDVYLSKDEPGLPGYKRAAAVLVKLEAALGARDFAQARALVDRFEEDLVHRRSLRVTVVIRQRKEGGNKRSGDRFVLPGTTLGTLLKRVGGRRERPEVRLDRGEWTRYGELNLRRKLADETVVELYLPDTVTR